MSLQLVNEFGSLNFSPDCCVWDSKMSGMREIIIVSCSSNVTHEEIVSQLKVVCNNLSNRISAPPPPHHPSSTHTGKSPSGSQNPIWRDGQWVQGEVHWVDCLRIYIWMWAELSNQHSSDCGQLSFWVKLYYKAQVPSIYPSLLTGCVSHVHLRCDAVTAKANYAYVVAWASWCQFVVFMDLVLFKVSFICFLVYMTFEKI